MRIFLIGVLCLLPSCLSPEAFNVLRSDPEPAQTATKLSDWETALHSEDPGERQEAARRLGGLPAEECVPVLIEVLGDDQPTVRGEAAKSLGSIGAPAWTALPKLENLLGDPSGQVRVEAAMALWRIDHQTDKAVAALLKAFRSKKGRPETPKSEWEEMFEEMLPELAVHCGGSLRALECIADIGPEAKAAVPALTELLRSPSVSIRVQAAWALWRITGEPEPLIPVLVEAIDATYLSNPMIPCIPHSAIRMLLQMGPEARRAALPPLIRSLEHKPSKDQLSEDFYLPEVFDGLAEIGPEAKAALALLLERLRDKRGDLRAHAAYAVWKIDPQTQVALPVLIRELKNRRDWVARVLAARFLAAMGPEAQPAVPALVEMLQSWDANNRLEAAKALGAIGPQANAAVPNLTAALKDRKTAVREEADAALQKIGP